MTQLSDLVGSRTLSGVDFTPDENNGSSVVFVLGGVAFKATEDPSDGYRSYLSELEETTKYIKNMFPPCIVVGHHEGPVDSGILTLTDVTTGKDVLKVGTENEYDYYPWCVIEYTPENMAVNAF